MNVIIQLIYLLALLSCWLSPTVDGQKLQICTNSFRDKTDLGAGGELNTPNKSNDCILFADRSPTQILQPGGNVSK